MHVPNPTPIEIRLLLLAILIALLAGGARAEVVTETLTYEHEGTRLEGFVAYDDSVSGPRPGVLVVHEWWGINDFIREQARRLARQGYVAFAADIYGEGRTTEDPAEAQRLAGEISQRELMRPRVVAGFERMLRHDLVDAERTAAIGYCFGGAAVLHLAYSGAEVDGVVSLHGSLPPPAATDRIAGKILILHGAADPLVPAERVTSLLETLEEAEVDYTFVAYGGAQHAFTNPKAGDRGMPGVDYQERAARRSWDHMQLFFGELFSKPNPIGDPQ